MAQYRPDRDGAHRVQFERNKQRILATQKICGICGKPVSFGVGYLHPLAPVIDHIIPVSKGGHPSSMENLQLAHRQCNRIKSDKLVEVNFRDRTGGTISNRDLPQSEDWRTF